MDSKNYQKDSPLCEERMRREEERGREREGGRERGRVLVDSFLFSFYLYLFSLNTNSNKFSIFIRFG